MIRLNVGLWVAAALGSLLIGTVPGCNAFEAETCLTYACVNEARLRGALVVPEQTGGVTVKYCSKSDCVEGKLDLREVGSERECIGSALDRNVCFLRDAAGSVQVDASLGRVDDMTLPPDGERYTLTIVNEASGETLLEETREADYEKTREDNCHLCWQAEMTL
jgi:hypothetical protein